MLRQIFLCYVLVSILLQINLCEGNTKNWKDVRNMLQQKSRVISRLFVRKVSRLINSENITAPCLESMHRLIKGLEKLEEWSLNMFDSSAKLPPGFFRGVLLELGSFDQCLELKVKKLKSEEEMFRGQYCMVKFHPPRFSIETHLKNGNSSSELEIMNKPEISNYTLIKQMINQNISFWIGMCFPSFCVKDDIQYMTQAVVSNLGFTTTIMDCQTSSSPQKLTIFQIFAISLLSVFAMLAIIGTIVDGTKLKFIDKSKDKVHYETVLTRFVKSFSIYANTKRLLNPLHQSLSCFHGIRFFTACWIILGHSYFLPETWYMIKLKNLKGFKEFRTNLALATIENFSLSVDTFFFMSGVLMTYSTWKILEKNNGRINIIKLLFRKYWRLTPSVAVAMTIPFIIPLMGSGPLWNIGLQQGINSCENRWWANLLYIQNIWNFNEICLPHSWYLASLMQCHIIGIPLLLISFRWKLIGLILGIVFLLISMIITAIVTEFYDLSLLNILITKSIKLQNPYLDLIYIKPYSHLPVYIIGMGVGFFLWKYPKPNIKLLYQVIAWMIALFCNVAVIYSYREFNSRLTIMLYSSIHRTVWSVGLAWLTYACTTGYSGCLNKFLSWKPFAVFAQLTYWSYLIHFFFLLAKSAYVRNNFYFNHYNMMYTVVGHIVLSFIVAYLFHVIVEIPFNKLEKIFFQRKQNQENLET